MVPSPACDCAELRHGDVLAVAGCMNCGFANSVALILRKKKAVREQVVAIIVPEGNRRDHRGSVNPRGPRTDAAVWIVGRPYLSGTIRLRETFVCYAAFY